MIKSEVQRQIVDLLDVDENILVPDARLRDDLGADSLDLAELIVALGQKFTVQVRDEDVSQIQTVGEAIAYIDASLEQ
ncbi:acyl carrier protein [Chloroflexi bacterium TSY]|nr:acyl carrier protein [Chloroflexi bacterium TSY]